MHVIAHRGASAYAPENTLAAFAKAAHCGATMVEFDCALTADNEVVVFHDEDFLRTAGVSAAVNEVTLAQLKQIDVGSWFSRDFAGERVPTFTETVACLLQHNLTANIEIKAVAGFEVETVEALVPLLEEWPKALASPIISSFSEDALRLCQRLFQDLVHQFLFANQLVYRLEHLLNQTYHLN